MRVIGFFLVVLGILLFYFSIRFGFNLKIAINMLLYFIVCIAIFIFVYKNYVGIYISKLWFYPICALILSFGFYPLLEFYSIKPIGWSVADWIGFKENLDITSFDKKWYGEWYGKTLFSIFFVFIGWAIQQLFDQD